MIKLIAMDLDGTLFDADHKTISKRNIEAITRAHNNGIKIVIASGRTLCQITDVLSQIPVDYVISSNGASSMDREGNIIAMDSMDFECWSKAYNLLTENNIPTEVFYKGETYLKASQKANYCNKDLEWELIKGLIEVITFKEDVVEHLRNKAVEKITSIYVPDEKYDYFKNQFENMGLAVTSSVPHNMEINRKGVNKGVGLNRLCDAIGIKADEVMAFGDGNNDLEMLQWAENSYAMENAVEEAKRAAKFVADTNYNDGIARVIEELKM